MRLAAALAAVALPVVVSLAAEPSRPRIENPAIDMDGFLAVAHQAARHRAAHRIGEDEFQRLAAEPGTIVLDARSKERYDLLHVKGAVNLSFPDITIESLAQLIPDKRTRVLIYCNNNFRGAEAPFPSKLPAASLNLATYVALYTYGYRNVYELGPLIEAGTSRLPFAGTLAR